jgi:16S rRNA (guanine527-N7)-methyltransferase
VSEESTSVQPLLDAYAGLVRRWASRLDLVSPQDLDRFEQRHIHDSLRLLPLLEELPSGPAVDVGSGAGLPGIPLSIAAPDRSWRLLEPRRGRAAFLEEVVRQLDLDCEVLALSAEEAASDPRLARSHALAVGRALAPPDAALALLKPLLAPGGVGALFVGAAAPMPPKTHVWSEGLAIFRA